MRKILIFFFLFSTALYAREVPNNTQGVANAQVGDHIIRSNGQRVVLTQTDINQARGHLGLGLAQIVQSSSNAQNIQNLQNSQQSSAATENRPRQSGNFGRIVILAIIAIFLFNKLKPLLDFIQRCKTYKNYQKSNPNIIYKTDELLNITTYQNNKISNEDIIDLFNSERNLHAKNYYLWHYYIFPGKDEQNYAWRIRTSKDTYGWGTVYKISFTFTNGEIILETSDTAFQSNGKQAIMGTPRSDVALNACREQAMIMWRAYGKIPSGYLPFSFVKRVRESSHTRTSSEQKTSYFNTRSGNEQKEKPSYQVKAHVPDLLVSHRDLLGLKLNFTKNELKKAYRKAVFRYHPDRLCSSEVKEKENAGVKMRQIIEAKEILEKSLLKH